ncbi:uncharacterized protein si:rp71-17i16.6 isoform X1 [Onychostoma macrolepis]|uniref:Uncharacterized protein n=1 Tax=Onychostoma macrolepis TaxID=369639 RepID=A0A7J6BSW8_9TELE|nr:uncharacterized protein si:rp71-17i16.6 isoform X1 [Onychostoma macrolepis]XP_058619259.1 uncharacterized protein si:rp71-17i16.6 isoform X1 [Onychostoma macrolepis]KAF4096762.1 hypothetical protein G5714_022731 [Onychostoma macrolepis]
MTKHNMMLENKLIEDDCHLKCKQYLISLFGESTAEYFLSPSSCSKEIPSWFSQLKDDMKDHTSAISLWDAMRQRSTQILQESNKEPSMVNTNEIVRRVTDWKTLKKQDHLMHLSGVKYMFRCAKRNQAISALLLKHNPLFNYGINNGLN